MTLAPPTVAASRDLKRIESDLRNERKYGFYGAMLGAVVGLAISSERVPRKTERLVHNLLLGASLGALVFGYISS